MPRIELTYLSSSSTIDNTSFILIATVFPTVVDQGSLIDYTNVIRAICKASLAQLTADHISCYIRRMSTVEHFHVLQTFLFGLILAHFLFAIAKIVIDGSKVYWLHILAVIGITEGIIATYFTLHKDPIFEWFTYGYEFFVFTFLPLGSLFVLAYMFFPTHKEITDYEKYFWDNAFKMSTVFALWIGPFMLRYIITFDIVEAQFGFDYAMGMVITLSFYFVLAIMINLLKLKLLVYVIFIIGLIYNTFWLVTIRIDFFP